MKSTEEANVRFWRKWDSADVLEQEKMCERLLVIRTIKDKTLKRAHAGVLNSCFQDLRECMLTIGCKRK